MKSAALSLVTLTGLAAGVLTGCASSPQRSAVADVAERFVTAVQAGQGAAACRLLTADAQGSAEGAGGTPCAEAVLHVREAGAGVHGVQIWGDAAQVKLGSDVIFLRHLGPGWQVRAAGCKPQPGTAYKCDIEG